MDRFNELVWESILHPEKVVGMKLNCLKEAKKYSLESVMATIHAQMVKVGCYAAQKTPT